MWKRQTLDREWKVRKDLLSALLAHLPEHSFTERKQRESKRMIYISIYLVLAPHWVKEGLLKILARNAGYFFPGSAAQRNVRSCKEANCFESPIRFTQWLSCIVDKGIKLFFSPKKKKKIRYSSCKGSFYNIKNSKITSMSINFFRI